MFYSKSKSSSSKSSKDQYYKNQSSKKTSKTRSKFWKATIILFLLILASSAAYIYFFKNSDVIEIFPDDSIIKIKAKINANLEDVIKKDSIIYDIIMKKRELDGKKTQLSESPEDPIDILLNKPKDFLTTASDPQGRKTVLDLIKGATPERVYPVGRLDRNTTGVLLLTNDGELAQKLTHPSFEIKKIYEVTLDKPVTKKDLDSIVSGITLEDGFVAADSVGYADSKSKNVVGIEIHSGRNRIVRRIFEHLGYDVKALDRVMFANLTKKNVERSKWRFLNDKEVRLLKFMNKSFLRKNKSIRQRNKK